MKSKTVIRFKKRKLARQKGELARLKVIQGADYGTTFVLFGSPVRIGRAEDNEVFISDLKASRRHLEITFEQGIWKAKDLGSSNGILHNGINTRSGDLRSGDVLILGETSLEFMDKTSPDQLLLAPPKDPNILKNHQSALEEHDERIRKLTTIGAELGAPISSSKGSSSRPIGAIFLLVGLIGTLIWLDESDENFNRSLRSSESTSEKRNLAALLPTDPDQRISKTADLFFKAGFREYREKNYLRAKIQFETVLQISPWHKLAKLYLENCKREISNEVKVYLKRGQRSKEAGKLREAKAHFQAVLRLLHGDPNDPAYQEAQKKLEELEKEELRT